MVVIYVLRKNFKYEGTHTFTFREAAIFDQHARECPSGTINWDQPKIIATFNDKKKNNLQQNLLIRESLEIRKQKTTRGLGLNDPQLCVRTNAWDPILNKLREQLHATCIGRQGRGRLLVSLFLPRLFLSFTHCQSCSPLSLFIHSELPSSLYKQLSLFHSFTFSLHC